LVALGSGMGEAGIFVAAMLAGMVAHDKFMVKA
jgi:TfoX/Sxy family transcriptional regulator of competence genes